MKVEKTQLGKWGSEEGKGRPVKDALSSQLHWG